VTILKNQSIKNKIIIVNMMIILIISVLASFVFTISEINNQRTIIYNSTKMDTKLIMEAISGALNFNDKEYVENVLLKMYSKPELIDCIVFDKSNNFFASHTKKVYHFKDFLFKNSDNYQSDDKFFYKNDVLNIKRKKIGSIYTIISTSKYKTRINSYIKRVLLLLVLVFFISFILSNSMQRVIAKPIKELSEITKDITKKKDLSIEVRYNSKDEIGVLYNNFNKMIKTIKEKEEERYKLQLQLQQSQKMEAIGQLAGGVAHDFNNILTAINGYADLAIKKVNDDKTLSKMLHIIRESGERAAELTRQLLAFSRKQLIEIKTIELSSIISSLEGMLQRLIEANTELKLDLADDCYIDADKSQIEQIIVNLIVNARDAIMLNADYDSNKIIKLQTEILNIDNKNMEKQLELDDGKYVVFSISDTGIGMNEDIKKKIFEPFFTTKPLGKGTGLGLATVYGIVKQNKGTVYVYSEINQGTTFKIYWPLSKSNLIDTDSGIETKTLLKGNEKLLIVEDNKSVLDFTSNALTALGYEIFTADSGEAALEVSKEHNYDFALIISDVIMPGMSGPEFIDIIKKKNKDIKVLYASGYTFDLIIKNGIVKKDINFIGKPFNTIELSQKIRKIIDT